MLAFRRLLACRAPALRFITYDSDYSDSDSEDDEYKVFKRMAIENQIEEIDKLMHDLDYKLFFCQSTIRENSEAVRKGFREKSGYSSRTPDVKTMLKALKKWEDFKNVPQIYDCPSKTPEVTKMLFALRKWEYLGNGFEKHYTPMRDVKEDLKLLASVRIMQAWKKLPNNKD